MRKYTKKRLPLKKMKTNRKQTSGSKKISNKKKLSNKNRIQRGGAKNFYDLFSKFEKKEGQNYFFKTYDWNHPYYNDIIKKKILYVIIKCIKEYKKKKENEGKTLKYFTCKTYCSRKKTNLVNNFFKTIDKIKKETGARPKDPKKEYENIEFSEMEISENLIYLFVTILIYFDKKNREIIDFFKQMPEKINSKKEKKKII